MGWKIRRIIALLVILGIIFVMQSKEVNMARAWGGEFQSELYNNMDLKEGEEDEKDQEKDEAEDEKEGEAELEPSTEEEIECFQSYIPEENGKNGYYISKPEVRFCHVSSRGTTKYRFTNADGKVLEGELREQNQEYVLSKEAYSEGINHLSVWMEEDGQKIEEFNLEKDFYLDTQSPKIQLQAPNGFDTWYQKEVPLSVTAEDGAEGSGIGQLVCFCEEQTIGKSPKEQAVFLISQTSQNGDGVKVTIRATDQAGNFTEASCRIYIDQTPPTVMLDGIRDYMITSKPVEVTCRVEEENQISSLNAETRWENTSGNTIYLPIKEWTDTDNGKSATQTLQEDGTYQICLKAADQSGWEAQTVSQVIIDQKNPVIRYVDCQDGAYLKYFCWNYPVEEWILDDTSCSYVIRLDGQLYHMGEKVTKEGRHVLTVEAIDAAGNIGEARAEFVIDHTPPEVCFLEVEEGVEYEEKKTFQVKTEDSQDCIEEIKINGEKQELNSKEACHQYTVKETGNYEVEVKASDQAGNQVVSRLSFQVIPKKNILQKLTSPIQKRFGNNSGGGQEKEVIEDAENAYGMIALGILGMAAAVTFGICYWKKTRKREDVG